MEAPHVLALPFPAQGHVIPLMQLSHRLVENGIEVTFVNTEVNHELVLDAMPADSDGRSLDGIHLLSIPDGLAGGDDRKDLGKLVDSMSRRMPGYLEELVRRTEASRGAKISWLIADEALGWAFEVAKKLGIKAAGFWTSSAAHLAITFRIPQLIQDGVIDDKGWPKRQETLQLAPGMPPLHTSHLSWNNAGAPKDQSTVFFQLLNRNNEAKDLTEVIVCNSFHDAEPGAFKLYPNILPVGPLCTDWQYKKPVGQFLAEDTSCLKWLDAQPYRSVVYVAFGSFTVFSPRQFEELALGLELTGRPFLWVVRPDFTAGLSKAWLDGFRSRVGGTGMIVSWCPQQQVLAHRAVACFLSHCGWNSTLEGVWNAVPFLCWPYFTDQFLNESYICNVWRTGLAVALGADGVVTKEELSGKVERVLGDDGIKERAGALRDAACSSTRTGGSSHDNFKKFVELMRP